MVAAILKFAAISVGIYFAIALGLIASQRPAKMAGEGGLDFSTLTRGETGEPAELLSYKARDGSERHYRSYASGGDDAPLLVFIHGSGWHSLGYDGLAKTIAASGAADVVLPDLRGHGEDPERRCDIYIADTLGEMGLWYRAAPISFIGGSLVEIGGHNPFEPALLGSAIMYGPHVENFRSAYDRFARAKAAVMVQDGDALADRLVQYLPPDRAAALANAAWAVSSEGADVTRQVWEAIDRHLPGTAG